MAILRAYQYSILRESNYVLVVYSNSRRITVACCIHKSASQKNRKSFSKTLFVFCRRCLLGLACLFERRRKDDVVYSTAYLLLLPKCDSYCHDQAVAARSRFCFLDDEKQTTTERTTTNAAGSRQQAAATATKLSYYY
jgi:hypothetical protein